MYTRLEDEKFRTEYKKKIGLVLHPVRGGVVGQIEPVEITH